MQTTQDILGRAEGYCPICGIAAKPIGFKDGRWRARPYHLARCGTCAFAFVTDPDTDFDAIYNADYYRGKGADPLIDYESEVSGPARSARAYELRGLVEYAKSSIALEKHERWLDYGSGLGGFVKHLRSAGIHAVGYDQGYGAAQAMSRGLPMLTDDELDRARATFGVVSAIEVLEHVLDPVETMQRISELLKPGGLFLYTTGNAAPFRACLQKWSYVVPEIHISFYEPQTLKAIFDRVGLVPLHPAKVSALEDIIRYKIMKVLGLSRGGVLDRLLPWPIVTRVADRRFQVSAMVLAVKANRQPETGT